MIAFLADRYKAAWVDIRDQYEVVEMVGNDRGKIRMAHSGDLIPFRIIVDEEHLRGLRLTDFRVLRHARPGQRMIAMARACVR